MKLQPLIIKRASWSKRERLAKFEAQKDEDGVARCGCGCGREIFLETAIGEHVLAVALGNTAKPDSLWAPECSAEKTTADRVMIAKADRQGQRTGPQRKGKKKHLWPSRPLKSKGFDGWRKFDGGIVKRKSVPHETL